MFFFILVLRSNAFCESSFYIGGGIGIGVVGKNLPSVQHADIMHLIELVDNVPNNRSEYKISKENDFFQNSKTSASLLLGYPLHRSITIDTEFILDNKDEISTEQKDESQRCSFKNKVFYWLNNISYTPRYSDNRTQTFFPYMSLGIGLGLSVGEGVFAIPYSITYKNTIAGIHKGKFHNASQAGIAMQLKTGMKKMITASKNNLYIDISYAYRGLFSVNVIKRTISNAEKNAITVKDEDDKTIDLIQLFSGNEFVVENIKNNNHSINIGIIKHFN